MALEKTTILPTDNPTLAASMFRELVEDEPLRLFVVVGTDAAAEALIARVDKILRGSQIPRRAVWCRDFKLIENVVKDLTGQKLPAPQNLLAFAISVTDEVRDVITRDEEEELDFTRILAALAEADRL